MFDVGGHRQPDNDDQEVVVDDHAATYAASAGRTDAAGRMDNVLGTHKKGLTAP
jgi:calcineurin-like phosphoesterase